MAEWNKNLPAETTVQIRTRIRRCPNTPQSLEPDPLQRAPASDGRLHWLLRKDQCMHCAEPRCLIACPAPGAIVQYHQRHRRLPAGPAASAAATASTGCPFNVPKFSQKTQAGLQKCTLCVDRVSVGLQPACIKACPRAVCSSAQRRRCSRGRASAWTQLKANGFADAAVYDPPESAARAS